MTREDQFYIVPDDADICDTHKQVCQLSGVAKKQYPLCKVPDQPMAVCSDDVMLLACVSLLKHLFFLCQS